LIFLPISAGDVFPFESAKTAAATGCRRKRWEVASSLRISSSPSTDIESFSTRAVGKAAAWAAAGVDCPTTMGPASRRAARRAMS
jgi:hypothetical protein